MQEKGKFDCKINVIKNGLEQYMSFNINYKLIFINSFKCLNSSLDSLVKNLGKDDCKYLSQELDSKTLDFDKQKGFYPDKYMSGFEN